MTEKQVVTYHPHPRYLLAAGFCALLAGLFTWELLGGGTLATAIFALITLAVALWSGQAALSRVEVTTQGLNVYAPLRPPQPVDFRQLTSVTLDGRLNRVLTLIYHPQQQPHQSNGLLDLDAIRTIHLPTLLDQEDLLTHLQARMPL